MIGRLLAEWHVMSFREKLAETAKFTAVLIFAMHAILLVLP